MPGGGLLPTILLSPDPVGVFDPRGTAVALNPAFLATFGFSPRRAAGRFNIHGPTPRPLRGVAAAFRRACRGEVAVAPEMEIPGGKDGGGPRYAEATFFPLPGDTGRIPHVVGVFRDVTTRRSVEDELHERGSELRTVIDSVPFDIFLVGTDGRYFMQNRSCREHWGDVIGRHPREIAPDRRTLRVWEGNNRRALAGETIEAETRFTTRDGERVFFNVIAPIRDGGGIRGLVGVNLDITAQKRLEQELRESEESLHRIIDSSPLGILLHEQGRILLANPAAGALLRVSPTERLIGRSVMGFVRGEAKRVVKERYRRLHRGPLRLPSAEYALTLDDGAQVDVEMVSQSLIHGGSLQVLTMMRDVTERRQAQREILLANRRLQHVLASTKAVIYTCDPSRDCDLTFISESIRRLTGHEPRQFLGNSPLWMEHVHPDDRPRVPRGLPTLSAGDRRAGEYRFRCRDGSYIWVRDEVKLLRDRAGKPVEMAGYLVDISESKAAEEALRAAKETLEAQNAELRRLDELKNGIMRAVSHELKTPVAKHAMQLDLFRDRLRQAGLLGDFAQPLGVMEAALRRQENVILNILTLGKLEAGRREYRREPVRLDQVVGEVVEDYASILDTVGAAVLADLPPLEITSDRNMLWHVFSNLLNNAVKYRQPHRKLRVRIACRTRRGEVEVRLTDNGIGLAAGEKERVFDSFYQASPSAEGIGVGLTIARMIVEGLGGRIALDSAGKGRGTTASVTLPAG